MFLIISKGWEKFSPRAIYRKVRDINNSSPQIRSIIDMARTVASSGQVGAKQSKTDAETIVKQLIGGADLDFSTKYGCNYWNHLKATLNEYISSRRLENEFVVKGSPFNWHSSIGTKCSAVILRKNFHKGDARVEPELFLEVGILTDHKGAQVPGVAYGFHYLPSLEGDGSPFIRGVLEDSELRSMAWALSNNGFVNPAYRSYGPSNFWNMEASLNKLWPEEQIPADLKTRVFKAFDELLPLYQRIIAL